jgi:fimbrial chaperone protein
MLSPSTRELLSRGLLGLCATLLSCSAFADLSLFPTRIVFEKNMRAAQVELMNTGTVSETYRINLVNRRMGEAGEFIAVETPGNGEQFAQEWLRYSPRQVTIPPGGSQTVRILLRKPADLSDGEYRSHLQFDRVANAAGASSVEALRTPGENSIGVVIQALVGASIPVIVRHGKTEASVSLSALSLQADSEGRPVLSVQMNRRGNQSVYGDFTATFIPKTGEAVEIAKVGGIAVYVPNSARRVRFSLTSPEGVALSGGTIKLSYRERIEAGGGLLAQASLELP